jgi:hypothetical protein
LQVQQAIGGRPPASSHGRRLEGPAV